MILYILIYGGSFGGLLFLFYLAYILIKKANAKRKLIDKKNLEKEVAKYEDI